MKAQPIIASAQTLLQDNGGVRWPASEFVDWINAGVREMAIQRPDILTETVTHTLVAGTRQTVPTGTVKLIEVVRNVSGRPVSLVNDRRMLDVSVPNWHNMTPVSQIKHFLFDVRDTDVFYVYPPAIAGAEVDVVVAKLPAPVTYVGSAFTQDEVGIPDAYENALLDYVLYRAWSKDSEYAANAAKAASHYQAFAASLTGDLQANVLAGPKKRGSVTPESAQ